MGRLQLLYRDGGTVRYKVKMHVLAGLPHFLDSTVDMVASRLYKNPHGKL